MFHEAITGDGSSPQSVSASELVRKFGYWQQVANEHPVLIMHHGRPRWALVATRQLQDLERAREADPDGERAVALHALASDHMRVMMFVLAPGLTVQTANRAAMAYVGTAIDRLRGQPFETLVPAARRVMVADALARVRDSGITETLDFDSPLYPDRRLQAEMVPLHGGVVVFMEDVTVAEDLCRARAAAQEVAELGELAGDVAIGTISARGMLVGPPPALATLSGLSLDQLAGVRFTSLLDVADRARVNHAIDATFETGTGRRIEARLLCHGATPAPVVIALVPGRQQAGAPLIRYFLLRSPTADR